MIFGPVLPVELVTSARRARYFLVRVVYAAILLIILWIRFDSSMTWRGNAGTPITPTVLTAFATEFFQSFAIVQVLAVLLLTPALVAGSIAEEKERRTLEYLLVTDLTNGEIVLGKLAARLLHLVMLIAVGWPVLALLRLLGGVSMEDVLASFAITASTALATASLSIWSSVQARRSRDAVMRVFVIELALLLLPVIADSSRLFSWPFWDAGQPVLDELLAANPIICLDAAIAQTGTQWDAVVQLARNQAALTVPCVLLALWRVRRVYLKQNMGAIAPRHRKAFRLWRPRLSSQPMLWKELFAERPAFTLGIVGLVAQALLFLGAIVPGAWILVQGIREGRHSTYNDELQWYVVFVGTAVGCVGLIIVAVHAAGSITAERERQTWDVLLTTPMEPWQIILGKIIGSLYAIRGMLLVLLILWVLGILGHSIWMVMLPIVLIELAIFGLFASLIGILFSLRFRTSLRAMAATVGAIVFLGGGYLLCCAPAWSGSHGSELMLTGCVPFLLALPLTINPAETLWITRIEADWFLIAYVAGGGLYFVATLVLYAVVSLNFDELTGRACRSFTGTIRRPIQASRIR